MRTAVLGFTNTTLGQFAGVTFHSHRRAWAERAKTCGIPELFEQKALGRNSKDGHRAYVKHALMRIPSLEDYKKKAEGAAAKAA